MKIYQIKDWQLRFVKNLNGKDVLTLVDYIPREDEYILTGKNAFQRLSDFVTWGRVAIVDENEKLLSIGEDYATSLSLEEIVFVFTPEELAELRRRELIEED